jgi:hypothetical protein
MDPAQFPSKLILAFDVMGMQILTERRNCQLGMMRCANFTKCNWPEDKRMIFTREIRNKKETININILGNRRPRWGPGNKSPEHAGNDEDPAK